MYSRRQEVTPVVTQVIQTMKKAFDNTEATSQTASGVPSGKVGRIKHLFLWCFLAITLVVSGVAAGFGPVEVTVDGLASNQFDFKMIYPPELTSLNPTSGTVGTEVTVTGSYFGSAYSEGLVGYCS